MSRQEIDAIHALLTSKPRPVGWAERRARLDEVGSVWPVADDASLETADLGGVPGEWSLAPESDASRVVLFFHGGGYCSGSIVSHRRMMTEAGAARHACARLPSVIDSRPSIPFRRRTKQTHPRYRCAKSGLRLRWRPTRYRSLDAAAKLC